MEAIETLVILRRSITGQAAIKDNFATNDIKFATNDVDRGANRLASIVIRRGRLAPPAPGHEYGGFKLIHLDFYDFKGVFTFMV